MKNEFTAIIERDGEWYVGYCPEVPGANGQGRTVEECRANLSEAIALILEDRREDGLRGVPQDAIRENGYRAMKRNSLLRHLRKMLPHLTYDSGHRQLGQWSSDPPH